MKTLAVTFFAAAMVAAPVGAARANYVDTNFNHPHRVSKEAAMPDPSSPSSVKHRASDSLTEGSLNKGRGDRNFNTYAGSVTATQASAALSSPSLAAPVASATAETQRAGTFQPVVTSPMAPLAAPVTPVVIAAPTSLAPTTMGGQYGVGEADYFTVSNTGDGAATFAPLPAAAPQVRSDENVLRLPAGYRSQAATSGAAPLNAPNPSNMLPN